MHLLRPVPAELCLCSHPAEAHQHYRDGSDCSLCPAGDCRRFRSAVSVGERVAMRLAYRDR